MLSESFGVEEKGQERGLILPSDRSVKTGQTQLPVSKHHKNIHLKQSKVLLNSKQRLCIISERKDSKQDQSSQKFQSKGGGGGLGFKLG